MMNKTNIKRRPNEMINRKDILNVEELLKSIYEGKENGEVKGMIQQYRVKEVCHFRGYNVTIPKALNVGNDLAAKLGIGPIGQVKGDMWNPILFAVYTNNLELLEYMIRSGAVLNINLVKPPISEFD